MVEKGDSVRLPSYSALVIGKDRADLFILPKVDGSVYKRPHA